MKLHQEIPEWIPLEGMRVKIQYHNTQRLCNGCYGTHVRKDFPEGKKTWLQYYHYKNYIDNAVLRQTKRDAVCVFGKWRIN